MIRKLLVLTSFTMLMTGACQQSDVAITAAIEAKLAADEAVSVLEIDVDTDNGVVTMTGNIDDPAAKQEALRLARETEGVTDVVDMITVRTAAGRGDAPDTDRTIGESIDDAGITAAVKARLLSDPEVGAASIDVDTREGIVYLTGTVQSEAEKRHAIELTQSTDLVEAVEENIKVEKDS